MRLQAELATWSGSPPGRYEGEIAVVRSSAAARRAEALTDPAGAGSARRSPAAARRQLGTGLRKLRDNAGKKLEDAAVVLECSPSKISRLETGKGVPRPRDVRDLIKFYTGEPPHEADPLLLLAADGKGQEWWSDFRDVVDSDMTRDHISRYVALETDASEIRSFEPDLVPGLLQTPEYAEAIAGLYFPEHTAEERRRFVDFRMARQNVLRREVGALRLKLIIGEAALRRPVGGADVMRRQLLRLAANLQNGLSSVDFQVAPTSVVLPGALGGMFAVIRFDDPGDQDVVYLEGRSGATYLEVDQDVKRYDGLFDALADGSLSRQDSLRMVEEAVDSLA